MGKRLALSDRSVDLDTGRLDGGEVLRPMELKVLRYLADHAGQVVSHDELLAEVWGYAPETRTRTVYSTLHRLRQVLEADPTAPRHLRTVPGEGIQLSIGALPPPTNLSEHSDRFFGREPLLDALAARRSRLVTLLGPGGAGKTRLAREHARRAAALYPMGCWFCDLSRARTAVEAAEILCGVLELSVRDAEADSGAALAERGELLVILDNVESLGEGAAALASRWLREAPDAWFLATSREPLDLAGEQRLLVGPLDAPGSLDGDAVRLLVDRIRATDPSFEPAPVLAELGALLDALDRLPLALELAAPYAAVMGPAAVLEALAEQGSLRSRRLDRPERHRSLREVVAWSWERLSEADRQALCALGAFASSFDASGARAVLRAALGPETAVHEVLVALVERGWLARVPTVGPPRYRLFESARRFLAEHPPPEAAVEAHAARYDEIARALFEDSDRLPPNTDPHEGREIDEILAAATRRLSQGPDAAVPLLLWGQLAATRTRRASAMAALVQEALDAGLSPEGSVLLRVRWQSELQYQGRLVEAEAMIERLAIEAVQAGRPDLAAHLESRGALERINEGRIDAARAAVERTRRWQREIVSPSERLVSRLEGALANVRGSIADALGEPSAEHYIEAIAHFDAAGRGNDAATVRMNLAASLQRARRYTEAVRQLERCLADMPQRWSAQHVIALIRLGWTRHRLREPEEAIECMDAAVATASSGRTLFQRHYVHCQRGVLRLELGDVDGAAEDCLAAQRWLVSSPQPAVECTTRLLAGRIAHRRRDPDAWRLFDGALEAAATLGHGHLHYEALVRASWYLLDIGRPGEALDLVERGLERFATHGWAVRLLAYRGFLVDLLGEPEAARVELMRIREQLPVDLVPRVRITCAALAVELGAPPEREVPPVDEDPWTRVLWARLHLALGQPDEARALLASEIEPGEDALLARTLRGLRERFTGL